ncbi:MAG TPA: S8 family serine peptidase [Anaerolineales bacterium]|nr:S8 family serine peptidase [Anaerolineales bacterium]HNJ14424.1 S8 family serine peptidase [Anaerolineales bacterium]
MRNVQLKKMFSKLLSTIILATMICSTFLSGNIELVRALGGRDASSAQEDGNSLYYFANGNRIQLTPSLNWISVKFTSDDPVAQSAAVGGFGAMFGPLDQARPILFGNITLLPLKANVTEQALMEGIQSLRADKENFSQVNPVFQTPDAEMALTDEFIATFPSDFSMEDIDAVNAFHNVELIDAILGQDNTFLLRVAAGTDVLAMANLYQQSGVAIHSAPNFVRIVKINPTEGQSGQHVGPMAGTNDTYYPSQWHLNNNQQYGSGTTNDADIDAPEAWDRTTGNSSVVIAVIDEGVDLIHEDISPKLVAGYDATGLGSGGGPSGDDAHGTNVGGLAAASSNNGFGVAGVCQKCSIMPVRIAYSDAFGFWVTNDATIANGITWAYQNGASILNNSWGGGLEATVINTAIANAKTLGRGGKGSVVIFSAGNSNSSVSYPAYLDSVIAVAASNLCDQRKKPIADVCNGYEYWWGSNYGSPVDISAPGVWLYSTDITGAAGYASGNYFADMNGTSGAAPIVAGVAGLILSLNSNLTAIEVQTILQNTADDVNGGGYDVEMGYGRVNAYRAVQAVTTSGYTISGDAGIGGATLTYTDGTVKTATADSSGLYSFQVPSGWSGTVTPSKSGYEFSPTSRTYTSVGADQTAQDYTASVPIINLLQDPSFEAYTPNTYWLETSTNFGTPLCTIADCTNGAGTAGPRTGSVWAWFGGTTKDEAASLTQTVVFPTGTANLRFYLWIGRADSGRGAADQFTVTVDGVVVFTADATEMSAYSSYTMVNLDVSTFADGAAHDIGFSANTSGQMVNFNLDDITLAEAIPTFSDVPLDYWARSYIERLYNSGITRGCGSNPLTYCPLDSVTRTQMAIFILRGIHGSGYTPPEASGTVFSDVTTSTFGAAWIEQFALEGITSGCGSGKFCPNDYVTRAQIAIFLLKGKHGSTYVPPAATGDFTDVPVGSFAADWIEELAAEGITSGCGGGNFCPSQNVTRDQMAVFLVKTFNLP